MSDRVPWLRLGILEKVSRKSQLQTRMWRVVLIWRSCRENLGQTQDGTLPEQQKAHQVNTIPHATIFLPCQGYARNKSQTAWSTLQLCAGSTQIQTPPL